MYFYALNQHENKQQDLTFKTTNVKPDDIFNEFDDANPKEELRSCQQFLVVFEPKWVRYKFINYVKKYLNATIVDETPDHFFNNLKSAAEVYPALRFI